MKKVMLFVLLIGIVISCLGCTGVIDSSYHAQKDTYYAGETVKVFDNESNAQLATLRITNATVIRDEPYIRKTYLCSLEVYENGSYTDEVEIRGDSVYSLEEYAAVVQIDFTASTLDSSNSIEKSDFYVMDCNGDSADRDVETHYTVQPTTDSSFVVGLRELGDIKLSFTFNNSWDETCEIICEYDEKTDSYIIVEDEYMDMTCPACGKYRDDVDSYCRYCGEKLK